LGYLEAEAEREMIAELEEKAKELPDERPIDNPED